MQCECFLGGDAQTEAYYREVIAHKLPVYTTRFLSLTNQGKPDKASEGALILLKKFDCNFPRGKVRIIFSILAHLNWIKRILRQGALDDLLSRPADS